jgi:F-type H+-transporting ATPase subunit b
MHLDWSTLALQTVNFAVLVWLLHRFLYRPVLRVVDARRAEIDKRRADAEATTAKAAQQLAAVRGERDGIAAERAAALTAAAAQAEQAAAARRAQAERDAAALLQEGRDRLAREREAALAEAKRTALDLGEGIATRLLREIPAPARAGAWLERIAGHLAALPAAGRQALLPRGPEELALTVVTATPLPPEMAEAWQARLRQVLGGDLAVTFLADEALLAGADLHFPNAILRFSWQSALAALRTEVAAGDDAR